MFVQRTGSNGVDVFLSFPSLSVRHQPHQALNGSMNTGDLRILPDPIRVPWDGAFAARLKRDNKPTSAYGVLKSEQACATQ
jgi:hypothetical protein